MVRRALICGFALLGIVFLGAADAPPKHLEIFFIDVQGGAATLIVTPEKESILIDSGWPGLEDRDPKRIEHVLKDVAGLDHLDHLVTTHWHTDHYGGVAGLAKRVRIDHFWDRGLPDPKVPNHDRAEYPDGPKPDDPLGIAYRQASEGKRKALKAGDPLPLRGDLKAVVLASGGQRRFTKKARRTPPALTFPPTCRPITATTRGASRCGSLSAGSTFSIAAT